MTFTPRLQMLFISHYDILIDGCRVLFLRCISRYCRALLSASHAVLSRPLITITPRLFIDIAI